MQYQLQCQLRHNKRLIVALLIICCFQLAACGPAATAGDEGGATTPPAKVEPIAGTSLNKITLTADAANRIGIQTATVQDIQVNGTQELVVPYAAVIYDLHGDIWVYTNPSPLTYVRGAIVIDHVDGDQAVLTSGPPVGTAIVTVGAAELFGTELGVGSCGVCAP